MDMRKKTDIRGYMYVPGAVESGVSGVTEQTVEYMSHLCPKSVSNVNTSRPKFRAYRGRR